VKLVDFQTHSGHYACNPGGFRQVNELTERNLLNSLFFGESLAEPSVMLRSISKKGISR